MSVKQLMNGVEMTMNQPYGEFNSYVSILEENFVTTVPQMRRMSNK
jgi:hypothetical protein